MRASGKICDVALIRVLQTDVPITTTLKFEEKLSSLDERSKQQLVELTSQRNKVMLAAHRQVERANNASRVVFSHKESFALTATSSLSPAHPSCVCG